MLLSRSARLLSGQIPSLPERLLLFLINRTVGESTIRRRSL